MSAPAMSRDLRKYVLELDGWLVPELCGKTLAAIEVSDWSPHGYTGEGAAAAAAADPSDRALSVAMCADREVNRALMRRVVEATRLYVAMQRMPWLSTPAHHAMVRFNRYSEGAVMREHCDHITSLFPDNAGGVPILSVLFGLNDAFTGGELVFFGGEEIKLPSGKALVFPSSFMFPHRVDRVQSGVRYSCVSWAW